MKTTENYGLYMPGEDDFADVNEISENMEKIDKELKKAADEIGKETTQRNITLSVSGWSSVFPYTQTVQVAGVTANDIPTPGIIYPSGCTREQQKAINKAAGYIYDIETGAGTVTVRCTVKPATAITLGLKGVV